MKNQEKQMPKLFSTTVEIKRVTNVAKGGRVLSFTALVIVGDEKGAVGYGLGKAKEVSLAIQKGTNQAKKRMVSIPLHNGTLPHSVEAKYKGGRVLLKRASQGTGVIAGGAIRIVMNALGVTDVLTKSKGSTTAHSIVRATVKALQMIRTPHQIAKERNVSIDQVFNG